MVKGQHARLCCHNFTPHHSLLKLLPHFASNTPVSTFFLLKSPSTWPPDVFSKHRSDHRIIGLKHSNSHLGTAANILHPGL